MSCGISETETPDSFEVVYTLPESQGNENDFSIYYYPQNKSQYPVIHCTSLEGSFICFKEEGFNCKRVGKSQIIVTVPHTFAKIPGKLVCQSGDFSSEGCQFSPQEGNFSGISFKSEAYPITATVGNDITTKPRSRYENNSSLTTGLAAGLVSLAIIIIIVVVFLLWRRNKYQKKNNYSNNPKATKEAKAIVVSATDSKQKFVQGNENNIGVQTTQLRVELEKILSEPSSNKQEVSHCPPLPSYTKIPIIRIDVAEHNAYEEHLEAQETHLAKSTSGAYERQVSSSSENDSGSDGSHEALLPYGTNSRSNNQCNVV